MPRNPAFFNCAFAQRGEGAACCLWRWPGPPFTEAVCSAALTPRAAFLGCTTTGQPRPGLHRRLQQPARRLPALPALPAPRHHTHQAAPAPLPAPWCTRLTPTPTRARPPGTRRRRTLGRHGRRTQARRRRPTPGRRRPPTRAGRRLLLASHLVSCKRQVLLSRVECTALALSNTEQHTAAKRHSINASLGVELAGWVLPDPVHGNCWRCPCSTPAAVGTATGAGARD